MRRMTTTSSRAFDLTVQGILRHEDVRTTMQLYAQSDQESRLEAHGKFLALLLGDKAHLLKETIQ